MYVGHGTNAGTSYLLGLLKVDRTMGAKTECAGHWIRLRADRPLYQASFVYLLGLRMPKTAALSAHSYPPSMVL